MDPLTWQPIMFRSCVFIFKDGDTLSETPQCNSRCVCNSVCVSQCVSSLLVCFTVAVESSSSSGAQRGEQRSARVSTTSPTPPRSLGSASRHFGSMRLRFNIGSLQQQQQQQRCFHGNGCARFMTAVGHIYSVRRSPGYWWEDRLTLYQTHWPCWFTLTLQVQTYNISTAVDESMTRFTTETLRRNQCKTAQTSCRVVKVTKNVKDLI